jgi:glycosyltransferase involved in cell wall biosynthesis
MNRNTPLATIAVPVYNGENYLTQALDSILNQTFTDFEIIISDNCSTDSTPEIARAYAERDPRVRYHRNEHNVGANPNFNQTVSMARGRYFKWAAHDDVLAPTYLERCVAELEADPSVVLAHSYTRMINSDGSDVPLGQHTLITDNGGVIYMGLDAQDRQLDSPRASVRFREIILRTDWCCEIFGVMRLDVLRQTPLLINYYGADKSLLAEMATRGRYAIVPEPLFSNRRHEEQSMSQITTEQRTSWSNPKLRKQGNYRWQRLKTYTRSALVGKMSLQERLLCIGVVVRYYVRFRRIHNMLEEVSGLRLRRLQKQAQARAKTHISE